MPANILKNAIAQLKRDHNVTHPTIKACLLILERKDLDYSKFNAEVSDLFLIHFNGLSAKNHFDYIKKEWPPTFNKLLRCGDNLLSFSNSTESIAGTLNMVLWELFCSTNLGELLSLYIYVEMGRNGLIPLDNSASDYLSSMDCRLIA